jgi:D-serine deaminase-like pyridoxal phosphate-dependent protein
MNFDQIDSPSLVVYPSLVRENIAEMIKMAGSVTRLRPHIKTHKTAEGIQLMQEQGIYKFKCATIAEAELLAINRSKDVLLAHQPVGVKIDRLIKLITTYPVTVFSTIVDDIEQAKAINLKLSNTAIHLNIYIDINVGMNRTGIAPNEAAIELYEYLHSATHLSFAGLHVYDGQHRQADPLQRELACDKAFEQVYQFIEKLEQKGFERPLIIAGGSPSFSIHAKKIDRECSPGTNIFWDHGYATICPEQHFTPALHIVTRVISKPSHNRVCLDLGHKAVASENEITKRVYFPSNIDLKPVGQSEEHLVMETEHADQYKVGDILIGIPYHICPTVALHETLIAIENDQVIGEWQVAARKRKINI